MTCSDIFVCYLQTNRGYFPAIEFDMMIDDPDFLFTKWYLDCVTENGDTFLGYSSSLRWGKIHLHFASTLLFQAERATQRIRMTRRETAPADSPEGLVWDCRPLGVKGVWRCRSIPIAQILLSSDAGEIHWVCVQPGSNVELHVANKLHFSGLGYVERLEMTIKPWQLPIAQLRWGRYISDKDEIVWIEWQGKKPRVNVFHNSVAASDVHVSDDEIVFGDGLRLELTCKQILREGRVGPTLLSGLPLLAKTLPLKMLRTYECKWRSRGVFRSGSNILNQGWVIHEVVRFDENPVSEKA